MTRAEYSLQIFAFALAQPFCRSLPLSRVCCLWDFFRKGSFLSPMFVQLSLRKHNFSFFSNPNIRLNVFFFRFWLQNSPSKPPFFPAADLFMWNALSGCNFRLITLRSEVFSVFFCFLGHKHSTVSTRLNPLNAKFFCGILLQTNLEVRSKDLLKLVLNPKCVEEGLSFHFYCLISVHFHLIFRTRDISQISPLNPSLHLFSFVALAGPQAAH